VYYVLINFGFFDKMLSMYDFAHPEFPAFRHQLAPMKAQRQALSQLPMAELQLTLRHWICPQLLRAATACKGRRHRWLPLPLLFFAFLWQVLNLDSSCRATVRMLQSWWLTQGRTWAKADTAAYCLARKLLPLSWLIEVWKRLARATQQRATLPAAWHHRRVYVVDGTTLLTSDTPKCHSGLSLKYHGA
jgi:hypothetical protein